MKKRIIVPYRRKREGRTNYRKRIELLKSGKPKVAVRKTNTRIIAQVIEYGVNGDKVIVTASSNELKKYGWTHSCKSLPASYLTGMLLAKKSLAKKVSHGILDIGLNKAIKGTRLFACLKGCVDGGLNIPHNEKMLPSESRIKGEHIAGFAKAIADKKASAPAFQFSKSKPDKIVNDFENVKASIAKDQ